MDEIISSICKNRHVSDLVCLSFVVGVWLMNLRAILDQKDTK